MTKWTAIWTPGPWKITRGHKTDRPMGIEADGGWNIVNFGGISQPASEGGESNARLIAAAPDMIEALIRCYKIFDKSILPNDVKMLKSVIEKATGQSIEQLMEDK